MAKIVADKVEFEIGRESLDTFMGDMQNFREIMPEQVEDWSAEKSSCSFVIKNLGKLGMRITNPDESGSYKFSSTDESKVAFTLKFNTISGNDGITGGYFEISAEMNPLVEMMAKRPLTNFVNILTDNLKQNMH